jgi:Gallidermin.
MTAMLETTDMLDLDVDVDAMPTESTDKQLVVSFWLCTNACTSRQGGSLCSYCC